MQIKLEAGLVREHRRPGAEPPDSESENRIQIALDHLKQSRSTIVIAHRL